MSNLPIKEKPNRLFKSKVILTLRHFELLEALFHATALNLQTVASRIYSTYGDEAAAIVRRVSKSVGWLRKNGLLERDLQPFKTHRFNYRLSKDARHIMNFLLTLRGELRI